MEKTRVFFSHSICGLKVAESFAASDLFPVTGFPINISKFGAQDMRPFTNFHKVWNCTINRTSPKSGHT